MIVLAWPRRDKKTTPRPNLEKGLMMEAWHLPKNEEEGFLPLATFPLIIKLKSAKFLQKHPLAYPL